MLRFHLLIPFSFDKLNCSILQVNLGSNQYLFSTVVDPKEMPCFCLRHDVDALLWQPHPDQQDMWEHISTFNALGRRKRLCNISL